MYKQKYKTHNITLHSNNASTTIILPFLSICPQDYFGTIPHLVSLLLYWSNPKKIRLLFPILVLSSHLLTIPVFLVSPPFPMEEAPWTTCAYDSPGLLSAKRPPFVIFCCCALCVVLVSSVPLLFCIFVPFCLLIPFIVCQIYKHLVSNID